MHRASVCALLLAACGLLGQRPTDRAALRRPASIPPAAAVAAADLPEPLAGFSDEGTFRLYVQGTPIAATTFRWSTDGRFRGRTTTTVGGESVESKVEVSPGKDGRWRTIRLTSPAATVDVSREHNQATVVSGGKGAILDLPATSVLWEDSSPPLLTTWLRRLARGGGARLDLGVLVIGGAVTEGSVERLDKVTRSVGGFDHELERYRASVAGVGLRVWADPDGRVVLVEVPEQSAAYVRDGYEALLVAEAEDPTLSRPEHEVLIEAGVKVPMRDGVALATDIYRPKDGAPAPVILIRTPYKKELEELRARNFARRGYVCAVQDVRGRFASPGAWEPFLNEGLDGYDSIEWLAAQPWSTGKIGMIGGSYVGYVQWRAAVERPPHLTTIIPNVTPPDPLLNIPYENGIFFLEGALWWASVLDAGDGRDRSSRAMAGIEERHWSKLLAGMPVVDLDRAVLGKEDPSWRAWIAHPEADAYWARGSYLARLDQVDLPVFHQSGWFDGDGVGTKLAWARMAGKRGQRLVLGPWAHTDRATRRVGERDFGPEAIIGLDRDYLRWLDHYLKGIDNGVDKEPPVRVFVMGENRWIEGASYPLPGTRFDRWYLDSAGSANGSGGDGRLARTPPAGAATDTYLYRPDDPTPHPDAWEEPEQPEGSLVLASELDGQRRAYHAKVTAARADILVYVSEPMAEPYTFVGPVEAVLWAASTAKDTDWFVSLMDVDEKGEILPLVQGRVRARYRGSLAKAELLVPGKAVEYHLDLWQTGITLGKGHRLRIEIASAAFPVYARNLNTGGHNETESAFVPARQTVYHGGAYQSYVVLPALPR
jgi:uncharacterized protein